MEPSRRGSKNPKFKIGYIKQIDSSNQIGHAGSMAFLAFGDKDAVDETRRYQALCDRARDLGAEGRHAEALPLHQEIIVLCEELFGAENKEKAIGLHNLAMAYEYTDDIGNALKYYESAALLAERLPDADRAQRYRADFTAFRQQQAGTQSTLVEPNRSWWKRLVKK